jgi:predicted TIM-barrel fold metal-dependent hydrolase
MVTEGAMLHEPTLPIKLDSTSNGEYAPLPVGGTVARAKAVADARIAAHARRTGRTRRDFLASLCGAATTLLTLNEAFGWRGNLGGSFELPRAAAFEPAAAAQALGGRQFIFDIQTHMVEPDGAWRRGRPTAMGWLASTPQGQCGEADVLQCFDARHFVKEVFLDSDTDMAVLSFVPELPESNPLSLREAARVRELVAALGNGRRLLLHAMVVPNAEPLALQLERMEEAHRTYAIAAWKVYTQWGPRRVGWWLDDPRVGVPFIEQARRLGVKTICIHKGLSFDGYDPRYAACDDIGRVARMYPDVTFIVYHSGIEARRREGAYDARNADRGIDSLIKSLHDNGVGPNGNVYAELGSTWRLVMRDPTQAAHTLGKLLKHVGPQRVLWGTDSIWYGSPQDQIQAFRTFQISRELQDRHGYPALTPALRADVFGLSAAPIYRVDPAQARRRAESDPVGRLRASYRQDPRPSFATFGPRDGAEWRRFRAIHGAGPG